MNKPISLMRKEYIQTICTTTNNCGLPAFVVVDVLERILSEMRKTANAELKRDEAMYRKALADENKKSEVNQDGEDKQLSDDR